MWTEALPYILQVVVILSTAGVLGSFKFVREGFKDLWALPAEFKKFEDENAADHATVRASVRSVQRSQDKLSEDLQSLQLQQIDNTIELAKHEVRINQLDQ